MIHLNIVIFHFEDQDQTLFILVLNQTLIHIFYLKFHFIVSYS